MNWQEILAKALVLFKRGAALKTITEVGAADKEGLNAYFKEREEFNQDVTAYLKDMPGAIESQFSAINETLKKMQKAALEFSAPKKELTRKDVAKALSLVVLFAVKGPSAIKSVKNKELMSYIITPGEYMGDDVSREMFGKMFLMGKDAIDTNLYPGSTNAGLTVNPVYETELIKYAASVSVMADKIRKMPMTAPQHSWPALDSRNMAFTRTDGTSSGITWAKGSKIASSAEGPRFGARVTLLATTLAAYVPWVDEFKDDLQINEALDSLIMECFMEAYAVDLDTNVLAASTDAGDIYDGILYASGTQTYRVAADQVLGVDPHELKQVPLKIASTERINLHWILHETVLAELVSKQNAFGDYMFWLPATMDTPAKLANYPYIESDTMPDLASLSPGDPFMVLANPQNMWMGERQGIEIKKYDLTAYNLEYGENFTRMRTRNGFKQIKTAAACVVKLGY